MVCFAAERGVVVYSQQCCINGANNDEVSVFYDNMAAEEG